MSLQSSTFHNDPSSTLIGVYRRWAYSSPGLIVAGNAHVDRRFLESPYSLVLDEHSDLNAFRKIANCSSSGDTRVILQLNHAGAQCSFPIGSECLSPSGIFNGYRTSTRATARPVELSDIHHLKQRFVVSTLMALEAGFSGIQLHAAHGYLLSSFLSPHLNHRKDKYGGSLKNRMRLLIEIAQEIRKVVPNNFLISVKLNATDYEHNGLDFEQSGQVAQSLTNVGVDHFEFSGGSYRRLFGSNETTQEAKSTRNGGYYENFGAYFRDTHPGIPLTLTGGFRHLPDMNRCIKDGVTCLLGFARPFCVFPDLPELLKCDQKALQIEIADVAVPSLLPRKVHRIASWPFLRFVDVVAKQAWYRQISLQDQSNPSFDTRWSCIAASFLKYVIEQRRGWHAREQYFQLNGDFPKYNTPTDPKKTFHNA